MNAILTPAETPRSFFVAARRNAFANALLAQMLYGATRSRTLGARFLVAHDFHHGTCWFRA